MLAPQLLFVYRPAGPLCLSLSELILDFTYQSLVLFPGLLCPCASPYPALDLLQRLMEVLLEDRIVLAHREVPYALHLDKRGTLYLVCRALAIFGSSQVIVLPSEYNYRALLAVYLIELPA